MEKYTEIKKVKLTDKGLDLSYVQVFNGDEVEIARKMVESRKQLPHEDFMLLWSKLKFHLAHLTENAKPKSTEDKILEKFSVIGITWAGGFDSVRYTIYGTKRIGSKKLNLATPLRLAEADPDVYDHEDGLNSLLMDIQAETEQYIEGKGKEVQLELSM